MLTSLCELFGFQLTPRDVPDSMSAQIQNKVLKNKGKRKSLIGKHYLQYTLTTNQKQIFSCRIKKQFDCSYNDYH